MILRKLAVTVMLFVGLLGFVVKANAAGMYGGLQYAATTYSTGTEEYDIGLVVGRFGFHFSDNLSVEGRVGAGVSDDSVSGTVSGFAYTTTLEIDQVLGLYAVGHLPMGPMLKLYGFAGINQVSTTLTVDIPVISSTTTTSGDDSSVSYGVGADISMGIIDINIEYVTYFKDGDDDISGIAVGVDLPF